MKVCHVVFSTNRLEFLEKTFEANRKFDFTGLEVHHLFIDDYPLGRDNDTLSEFVTLHGYDEIILHKENLGITKTWQELFDIIKDRDYDYILHHEDDVELLHPLKVMDLIEILQKDNTLSQIQLKRNNWYSYETEEIGPKEDDVIFKDYRYEKATPYFWMLMSLYPAWIAKEPILSETGYNPSENVIAKYLKDKYNIGAGLLKTKDGDMMVNHIGDYSHGKRVAKDEPGWDIHGGTNPNIKYCSKTQKELKTWKIIHYTDPFPFVAIENTFTPDELNLIWDEIKFLYYSKKFNSPEKTGSAYDTVNGKKVYKKKNSALWISDIYKQLDFSNIHNANRKLIENKEELFNNHPSWFFKNIYYNQDNSLISYYENNDYYKSHTDLALLTSLTWFFKQPKKFQGGNLTFTDYNVTIEVNTNCTVIFPSCIKHEVSKISMKEEDLDDLNGRICITQFFGLSI